MALLLLRLLMMVPFFLFLLETHIPSYSYIHVKKDEEWHREQSQPLLKPALQDHERQAVNELLQYLESKLPHFFYKQMTLFL